MNGGATGAIIEGVVFFLLVIVMTIGAAYFPFKEDGDS